MTMRLPSIIALFGLLFVIDMPAETSAFGRSSPLIYAANDFPATASITEYPLDANGDTSPVATISGPDTGLLFGVAGLSVDSAGNLYAATSDVNGSPNAIVVYAPGANGDAAPLRTLTAASHGGVWSVATAEDSAGDLWVANLSVPAIEEFAPDASGDVAPIREIAGPATDLVRPTGIALSAQGDVWVADIGAAKVMRFGPHQTGDVAPKQIIAGPLLHEPAGVAVSSTMVWVSDVTVIPEARILAFSAHASGATPPLVTIRLEPFGPYSLNGGPVYFNGDVIIPALTGGQASGLFVFTDHGPGALIPRPSNVIVGPDTGLVSTGWIAVH